MCTLEGGGRGGVFPMEAAGTVAAVSAACAAMELLPPRVSGDDTFNVPVIALALGRWLFGFGRVFICGVYI